MKPIELGPNQPPRFYRGGAAIAALRGGVPAGDRVPEDWVGSTTTLFGEAATGLTRLPDGRTLRDLIQADPQGFLGPAHTERFGADPALLVKLLDAGERLPVHCHPDREFARRHLDCPYGKTEAWIVVDVRGEAPSVHLGFQEPVERETVDRWVRDQETATLLNALNPIEVEPGDAILVPAGVPHAIGAGVFIVELQEPTDLSVMLEWKDFPLDGIADGHLGLGYDVALGCVDRSGWGADRLAALRTRPAGSDGPAVAPVFPVEADPFFRADRVRITGTPWGFAPGFALLVVLDGEGSLLTEAGDELTLRRGATVLVPYAAGSVEIRGALDLVRCLPPAPDAA
jgi:mannose-6-phosphate isomerase